MSTEIITRCLMGRKNHFWMLGKCITCGKLKRDHEEQTREAARQRDANRRKARQ